MDSPQLSHTQGGGIKDLKMTHRPISNPSRQDHQVKFEDLPQDHMDRTVYSKQANQKAIRTTGILHI